jgi:hypothetical protein
MWWIGTIFDNFKCFKKPLRFQTNIYFGIPEPENTKIQGSGTYRFYFFQTSVSSLFWNPWTNIGKHDRMLRTLTIGKITIFKRLSNLKFPPQFSACCLSLSNEFLIALLTSPSTLCFCALALQRDNNRRRCHWVGLRENHWGVEKKPTR